MNRNKNRGTEWETAVVRYLQRWWTRAERRALAGNKDRADIAGIPDCVIECKDAQRFELATWMNETETERKNDGAELGILVIKRRRKGVDQAYAVVPLWQMVLLLQDKERVDGR